MKQDLSIEFAWRAFLAVMIIAAAAMSVVLIYSAFFAALGRQWSSVSVYAAMATGLAAGTAWLCYNRNELSEI